MLLGDSTQRKSRYLTDLQLLVLALFTLAVAYDTGLFTGARVTAFGQCIDDVDAPIMRYTRTALCGFMALLFWRKRGIDPTLPHARRAGFIDRMVLAAAFMLTLVADFFVILMPAILALNAPPDVIALVPDSGNATCTQKEAGWPFLVGLLLFAVVHILLIVRHSLGWRDAWANDSTYKRKLLISALAVFIPGGLFLWKVAPALGTGGNDVVEQIYFLVLLVGLWMAIGTLFRKAFPRTNATLIITGMAFFVVTDISLGLSHILTAAVCEGYTGFPMGVLASMLESLNLMHLVPLAPCVLDVPVMGTNGLPVPPYLIAAAKFLALVPDITYSPALLLLAVSAYPWPGVQRDDTGTLLSA